MTNSLVVSDLRVQYGPAAAVDGISFSVPKGTVFGFLGPNGAGKSSTIKAVLGLLRPASGTIQIEGIPADSPAARLKVGYVPEEATYYRYLTAYEALDFYSKLCGIGKRDRVRRIEQKLEEFGLASFARKPLGAYSKGMMQKVSLAQALIHDPELLVLDEPTTGLDPLAKANLRRLLLDLSAKGKTIFFSSHELSEVELICHSTVLLHRGRVLKAGTLEEILRGREGRSLEQFFLETLEREAR